MTMINADVKNPKKRKTMNLEFTSNNTAEALAKGLHAEIEECKNNCIMIDVTMKKKIVFF